MKLISEHVDHIDYIVEADDSGKKNYRIIFSCNCFGRKFKTNKYNMNNQIKKDLTSNWFKLLQNAICDDINKLEKNILPVESEETLSEKDSFNEAIMNGLRLMEGAKIKTLNSYLDVDIQTHLKPYLQKWPYIKSNGKNLKLEKEGLLFTDEIIADLFLV